ncbi:MAG: glycoside hydrolase family 3 C-terminal domain-containing protein [Prevotellaceae bacterium]|jgi:beta-glucosidase|nr:glycoside hydrolase family 3 C-terminal domain-containing protein [Prevotellaceae bacterium]
MKIKILIPLLMLTGAIAASCETAQHPYQNSSLPFDERAADLLSRLTLEEKILLMTDNSSAVERLGIPPYAWWNEALHGVARAGKATVFPQAIGLAATFDEQGVYEAFEMVSDEARAKHHDAKSKGDIKRYHGLTFWTPNINIFRDPRWGRGMETYGEDPYLTATLGAAVVRGLQGDPAAKYSKAHACAKHYAVHSGPEWNRHSFDAKNISRRDLLETYLPAFKKLVTEAKVKEVMCAYNRFEGTPCCGSHTLLVDILRSAWGFDGVVVSDCGAVDNFFVKGRHETHATAESAVADAVIAGTDLECGSSYKALAEACKAGLISEEQLDASVHRLLRARFELGLFDDDARVAWASIPMSVVESGKHRAKALEMARKSIVLLKNKNGALPLSKNLSKVAVLGPNANDSVMMWGNYNGIPTQSVTILQGIQAKLPKEAVVYQKACDWVSDKPADDSVALLMQSLGGADAIIFVGGISPSLEGEEMKVNLPGFKGGDRTSIELPQVQVSTLQALKKLGKPLIFVLCSGSAIGLAREAAVADAIVGAWYPGQEGGTAVADVLFGDYNPAGRLPLTFYASSDQLPDFQDYDMSNRTYRYFKGKPLFPFGYGLSYATFAYGEATLSRSAVSVGDSLSLSVEVANAGSVDGDEVVQLYVRNPQDPKGPIKSLRAFSRVNIKAGATESVTLNLPPAAFEFFDPQASDMGVKPGKYELLYGGSSDDSALKSVWVELQ